MKNFLINLLIKDCCKGRCCDECPFYNPHSNCYLTDIINILNNREKENNECEKGNENYEK